MVAGYNASEKIHENRHNNGINRRAFGALAGVALLGGGELLRRQVSGGSEAQVTGSEIEPHEEVAIAATEEVRDTEQNDLAVAEFTRDPNLYAGREKIDPEYIRTFAEDSPKALREAFLIRHEDVPTPDDFPAVFAERFNAAVLAGTTYDEVKDHLVLDESGLDAEALRSKLWQAKEAYLTEMDDKYTIPIFQGMFNIGLYSREDIEQNSAYKALRQARRDVLGNHWEQSQIGNFNSTMAAEVEDYELIHDFPGDEISFAMTINMSFTSYTGDEKLSNVEPTAAGPIHVNVETADDGNIRTMTSPQEEFQEVFNELSYNLAA